MKRILTIAAAALFAAALPVTAAGARTSGAHTARAASVSGLDEEWLTTGMKGDLFEVAGGKIAERKSHNPAVLKLARTLVHDHTMSYDESAALARKLGVDVPTAPTMSMTWELKMVSALRGRTFNHWYSSLEALDHEQDISETTDEVNNGKNAEVRKDARQELPMLQMHLHLSRAAMAASK
jgi:putative membrane protein